MVNIELLSQLRRAFKLHPQPFYVRIIFPKLGVILGKKIKKISTQVSSLKDIFFILYENIRNVSYSSWACEAELFSPLLRQKLTFHEIFFVRSLS